MTHLLLWGNAYAQIIRNGKGEVVALYPLMPNRMTVDRDENGQLYYEYQTSQDEAHTMEGSLVRLSPHDVLHIPGLGFDGLVGYSPIAMAKNSIGMAIACEEYGAKFFANGATPGGILEHPGVVKDPERIRESWNSAFGGSANSNKVAVLEEGLKYTPISISPEQAQFLETRKFQIDEIARIFRIPPHMIGDLEKSSFSNIEQQSLEFVKYTLDPWVSRWEQSMRRALLRPEEKAEYFFKFNVDGLLRGDYQSRMNGYATARQNGWMSANDIRELENLDRIPEESGGDLYLINGNMTKLVLGSRSSGEVWVSDAVSFTGELNRSCTADLIWGMHADTYWYAGNFDDWFLSCDSSLTADDIALWFQESLTCNAADSTADVDGLTTENAVTLKASSGAYATSGYFTTAAVEYGITGKCYVALTADTPTGTSVTVETSTSDDFSTWSDWAALGSDNTVQSDSAKYIKFRVTLATTDSSVTPTVRSIALSTPGESAFKKLTIQARSRWR